MAQSSRQKNRYGQIDGCLSMKSIPLIGDAFFCFVTKVAVGSVLNQQLYTVSKNISRMTNQIIYKKVAIGLLVGATLLSCKENKSKQATIDKISAEVTIAGKTENTPDMEDYFPGANFMKIIFKEQNGLSLSEEQVLLFRQWRTEHQSKVAGKIKQISTLEKELKTLSQEGAEKDELLKKVELTNTLRQEVASTKLNCRKLLKNNLNAKQWQTLVTDYQLNYPFVERTKMMDIIQHVNPLPNYMSVINANISELEISADEKEILDAWSLENHPKMMEMANKIISLEKDIYKESLKDTSKEIILQKFKQINTIRTQIVEKKTNCRNLVKTTLSEKQWNNLVDKTM